MSDKKKFHIQNASKGKTGTLVISGFISPWNRNAGAEIRKAFAQLESKYETIVIELINCYGGSVYEGWPTYNAIRNSNKKVITRAEGLVASMGSILFLAGSDGNREVAKGSRIMLHKATGGVMGDFEKLREEADNLESVEKELIEAVAEATDKDFDKVKAEWFKRGVDKYFSAKEAVDEGLANKVIGAKKVKKEAPKDILDEGIDSIVSFYMAQYDDSNRSSSNQNSNKKMEKTALFIAVLAKANIEISDNAGEEEILNAVKDLAKRFTSAEAKLEVLKNEKEDLVKTQKEHQDKMFNSVFGEAVKVGKLKEEQRKSMKSLADNSFEDFTQFVEGLSPRSSFTMDQQRRDKRNPEGKGGESRDEWTLTDWRKKDPKGLAEMKRNEPENYQELLDNLK